MDSRISSEVRAVEGKEIANSIDVHGSDDSCVVDPDT